MRSLAGWRRVVAGLAVSLLVVACGDGSDGVADAAADGLTDITSEDEASAPETEPDPEPEPEAPEPAPEPDTELAEDANSYEGFPIDQPVEDVAVIDEAYLDEVLRVLDENHADLVLRMRELAIDESSTDAYAAVLPELTVTATPDLQPHLFERVLEFEAEGWLRDDVQPERTEVESLLSVSLDCVSLVVVKDAEPLYAAPLDGTWFVGLEPRQELVDEAGTVWRLAGFGPSLGEELDYCAE